MFLGVPGCAVLGRSPDGVSGWATEPFFPQASPWKVAFSVSLTVLVILLLGAGCYTKREHSMKMQEMGEKETLCQTSEQDRQTKEEVLKDAGKAGQGSRLVNVAAGDEREELTTGPECRALGKSQSRAGGWGDLGGQLELGRLQWVCSWNVFFRGYKQRGGILWIFFLREWSSCFFVFTLFQLNFRKNLVSSAFPLELSASPS